MYTGSFKNIDRECEIYEAYDEVAAIAYAPPRFCERCGSELVYCSFHDSIGRFTLKAYCKKCHSNHAVSVREDKYEQRMLEHWTKLVKKRAENRCEMAGPDCSGDLHAHHIIPKHLEPSRKYDVENGICLCEAHHKKIHQYM